MWCVCWDAQLLDKTIIPKKSVRLRSTSGLSSHIGQAFPILVWGFGLRFEHTWAVNDWHISMDHREQRTEQRAVHFRSVERCWHIINHFIEILRPSWWNCMLFTVISRNCRKYYHFASKSQKTCCATSFHILLGRELNLRTRLRALPGCCDKISTMYLSTAATYWGKGAKPTNHVLKFSMEGKIIYSAITHSTVKKFKNHCSWSP